MVKFLNVWQCQVGRVRVLDFRLSRGKKRFLGLFFFFWKFFKNGGDFHNLKRWLECVYEIKITKRGIKNSTMCAFLLFLYGTSSSVHTQMHTFFVIQNIFLEVCHIHYLLLNISGFFFYFNSCFLFLATSWNYDMDNELYGLFSFE